MSDRKKKSLSLDCLGRPALLQLQALGIDVSKQLARAGQGTVLSHLFKGQSSKQNKYNISPKEQRTLDGIVFASKLELNLYVRLKQHGIKFDLQPQYVLQEKTRDEHGKAVRAIKYIGDFLLHHKEGKQYLIDGKGMLTQAYRIKEKLMLARGHRIHRITSVSQLTSFLFDHKFI